MCKLAERDNKVSCFSLVSLSLGSLIRRAPARDPGRVEEKLIFLLYGGFSSTLWDQQDGGERSAQRNKKNHHPAGPRE